LRDGRSENRIKQDPSGRGEEGKGKIKESEEKKGEGFHRE
jgi:hypothetical protein